MTIERSSQPRMSTTDCPVCTLAFYSSNQSVSVQYLFTSLFWSRGQQMETAWWWLSALVVDLYSFGVEPNLIVWYIVPTSSLSSIFTILFSAWEPHFRRLHASLHSLASYQYNTVDPLPSARQHPPSYCDCLEVNREYYQNCSVLDFVTQCSQSTLHSTRNEQFLQVKQLDWVCHMGTITLCVEAVV